MPLNFRVRVRNALSESAYLVLEPWGRAHTLDVGGVIDVEVEGPEKDEVVDGKSVRGDGGLLPVELDAQALVLWGWSHSNLDFVAPPGQPSGTLPARPISRVTLRVQNDRKTPARMLLAPGAREVCFQPKGKADEREEGTLQVSEEIDVEVRISGARRESSIPVMEFDLDTQGLVIRVNESLCAVERLGDLKKR
ncbi:hypothetical protein LZ198_09425 [Myxococcus sp. K15C18031901]|uniref:hypothetical protein n=1 Tax=Myxococcus dinghuensis TaxID=2906761 RepID=UPI0020A6E50F|nr:hypothetical protein [Myxococcus dinghuensis]MCP3099087.1 hypothetical protein [Myxococcus dinghuensis]